MEQIVEKLQHNIALQESFFATNETKEIGFRLTALKTLRRAIIRFEDKLTGALWTDLHKSKFDSYNTEIGLVISDLNYQIKNIKKWATPKRVSNSLLHLKSKSYIYSQPYGRVLMISPWNYPFMLLIMPLIGSISAGNCTTLKPSPYTPNVAEVIEEMISSSFDEKYISVFQGGREINKALLKEKFDYIFFTGSYYLGKIVMKEAANNLTPLTLELGGKSPCIIDSDANIKRAAKRICWGKFLNAGQTCIAPDYLLVHKDIKEEFVKQLKEEIKIAWGNNPEENINYMRIVNKANVVRLASLCKRGDIIVGGEYNEEKKYFAPTVIDNVFKEDPIMKEEIFGPVLPILTFENTDRAIDFVNKGPKPLAFYYFSQSKKKQNRVINETAAGGGCINDTIFHIANHKLPFGGVGNSGFGRYHGKYSFDTFSNKRSIVKKAVWLDVPFRYKSSKFNKWVVRFLLKNKLGI